MRTMTDGSPPTLAKSGQKTLLELDEYRYVEAPKVFGAKKSTKEMSLDDVKILVEWKLYDRGPVPSAVSSV